MASKHTCLVSREAAFSVIMSASQVRRVNPRLGNPPPHCRHWPVGYPHMESMCETQTGGAAETKADPNLQGFPHARHHQVTGTHLPTRPPRGAPWWMNSLGSLWSPVRCVLPLGTAPSMGAVTWLGIAGPRQWGMEKAGSSLTSAQPTVDLAESDAQRQIYWSCLAR